MFMLLEYCAKGSLHGLLTERATHRLEEPEAAGYFAQIVAGVGWMHRSSCVHRDLKLENMLLTEDNVIKVCDFGWSAEVEIEKMLKTVCGTTAYWSPEIWESEQQDEAVDLWALGCLLYELIAGHAPFHAEDQTKLGRKVLAVDFACPPWFSNEARHAVHCMIQREPRCRWRCEELSGHPWICAHRFSGGTAALPAEPLAATVQQPSRSTISSPPQSRCGGGAIASPAPGARSVPTALASPLPPTRASSSPRDWCLGCDSNRCGERTNEREAADCNNDPGTHNASRDRGAVVEVGVLSASRSQTAPAAATTDVVRVDAMTEAKPALLLPAPMLVNNGGCREMLAASPDQARVNESSFGGFVTRWLSGPPPEVHNDAVQPASGYDSVLLPSRSPTRRACGAQGAGLSPKFGVGLPAAAPLDSSPVACAAGTPMALTVRAPPAVTQTVSPLRGSRVHALGQTQLGVGQAPSRSMQVPIGTSPVLLPAPALPLAAPLPRSPAMQPAVSPVARLASTPVAAATPPRQLPMAPQVAHFGNNGYARHQPPMSRPRSGSLRLGMPSSAGCLLGPPPGPGQLLIGAPGTPTAGAFPGLGLTHLTPTVGNTALHVPSTAAAVVSPRVAACAGLHYSRIVDW
jgi:hypothetical protein